MKNIILEMYLLLFKVFKAKKSIENIQFIKFTLKKPIFSGAYRIQY
jgi:hypothetical protein